MYLNEPLATLDLKCLSSVSFYCVSSMMTIVAQCEKMKDTLSIATILKKFHSNARQKDVIRTLIEAGADIGAKETVAINFRAKNLVSLNNLGGETENLDALQMMCMNL